MPKNLTGGSRAILGHGLLFPSRPDGLPPGPRSPIREFLRYARAPGPYYMDCLARYGDPFTEPTVYAFQVVTARPELVREIFRLKPSEFDSFIPALGAMLGPTSLLCSSGEVHRRQRALQQPRFHRERVARMGERVVALAHAELDALRVGQEVLAVELAQRITFTVIFELTLGEQRRGELAALREAAFEVISAATPVGIAATAVPLLARPPLAGRGPWGRLARALARLDELLSIELRHRRQNPGGDSILDMLVEARTEEGEPLDDLEVRHQFVTLMLAGFETTAVSLAWALVELHRAPEALARLRAELDAAPLEAGALSGLPWLGAVMHESMRLHPIIGRVARMLRVPMELGGYVLPPGVAVAASTVGVHRRADLYPEPDRFRPERFLDRRPAPHEYFPFGGGNRRCIGSALASLEIAVTLGVWLRRASFEPLHASSASAERRGLSMTPAGGGPLRVRRRS